MSSEPVRVGPFSSPGEPTDAPPGSELKVRIMIERAARREPLFHPLDGMGVQSQTPAAAAPPTWWPPEPAVSPVEVCAPVEEDFDDDEAAVLPPDLMVLPLLEYIEHTTPA